MKIFTIDFSANDFSWLTEPSDITGNGLHFRPTERSGIANIDRNAVEWLMEHRTEDEDGYIERNIAGDYMMYAAGNAYQLIPV